MASMFDLDTRTGIQRVNDLLTKIDDDSARVSDCQEVVDYLVNYKNTVLKEINIEFTLAQLKAIVYAHGKKDAYVRNYWSRLVTIALAGKGYSVSWIYGEDYREAELKAIQRERDALTQDDIDALRQTRIDARETKEKAKEAREKAMTEPETIEEFQWFLMKNDKGIDALSDDQLARYDALVTQADIARVERERQQQATVAQVALEDTDITVTEDFHTKRGVKIWVAKLSDKVDRDVWDDLNQKAKFFGGSYSRYAKGWIFYEQKYAIEFAELQEGDGDLTERWNAIEEYRQENTKERFTAMANDLEAQADQIKSANPKTHTWRMASMRENALANAEQMLATAQTLRNMAQNTEVTYLGNVRFLTQIDKLERLVQSAWQEATHKENRNIYIPPEKRRPIHPYDVRYVDFKFTPRIHRRELFDLAMLAREEGTILASRRLQKLADNSTAESGYITGRKDVEALRKIAYRYASKNWTAKSVKDRFVDIDRITRMGIGSLSHLRAVLREYIIMARAQAKEIDPIQQAILDVAGLDIPDFHPTPENEARIVLERARIEAGHTVLEPSAGWGAIADLVREEHPDSVVLDVVEIHPKLRQILSAKNYNLVGDDFLEFEGSYDRIVGNVPFSNMQDIRHVYHAYDCLNEDGILALIVGDNVRWRESKEHKQFRDFLDDCGGTIESLDPDAFKHSDRPTATRSALIVIQR